MEKRENTLKTERMRFSGRLLERGFWLYAWKIEAEDGRCVLYVGRTGDSSSVHAGSPFNRIGQHLDFRASAQGNSMARNLRKAGIEPSHCDFDMIAIGPLFLEHNTAEQHRSIRDKVAALECQTAKTLTDWGYEVLGTHGSRKPLDTELWTYVEDVLRQHVPPCSAT